MKKHYPLIVTLFFLHLAAYTWAQSVSVSKNVYAPGEKIIVSYSGFTGDAKDWIDVVPASYGDGQGQGNWKYTNGAQSGTMEFGGFPYGEYEVRGFFRNETSPVRVRYRFRVGNSDQNLQAKTERSAYLPTEKITVVFSGFPGNSKDWIDIVPASYGDGQGQGNWKYTNGAQNGTMEFGALPEGNYEVRVFFNNETSPVRVRYPFTVAKKIAFSAKLCRNELSTFYAGMNSLGLCWGRLGSEIFSSTVISAVQTTLPNAIAAIQTVPCLDFDINKIREYSSRLPSLTQVQAVDEIDRLIKEIQGSVARANVQCDNGGSLMSLFIAGIHLGAAQAIANSFVCRMIPPEWQTNINNHLVTARDGLAGFSACIPSFNFSVFGMVPVNAGNAYEPVTFIIGIHTQVLWTVSLTNCCCYCK